MTMSGHAGAVLLRADVEAAVLERLEAGKLELPLLPEVATRVSQLTLVGDCDPKELADLIKRDQALAGHFLRVANSALFSRGIPITTLQMAISRLGVSRIREITLAISCQSRVFSVRGHEADVRALFRHSLAVAVFASEIARLLRRNVEDAFMTGLLHDVGRPIVMQAIADHLATAAGVLERADFDAAVSALHERVGSDVAVKWRLAERMAAVIRHHHSAVPPQDLAVDVALVRLADDLAHWAIERPDEDQEAAKFHKHPSLQCLNLYPDDLESVLKLRSKVAATLESFAA